MKSFRGVLAAAMAVVLVGLLALPITTGAQSSLKTGQGTYYYFFQVQNEFGEPYTKDAFVSCDIFSTDANGNNPTFVTHSAASLANGTGQAGPLYSSVNGIIHFYSRYDEPVDVSCFTRAGDSGRKARMSIRDHKLQIHTSGAAKIIRIPIASNTSPVSTGYYIPEGALVKGVAVRVDTAAATISHIDVGFGGNHAYAFRNALASKMQLGPTTTSAQTRGFNTYLNPTGVSGAAWPNGGVQGVPSNHLGVLLQHTIVQGGVISGVYNGGVMIHTAGGLEVTYTTSTWASGGGHLYVFFELLHSGRLPGGQGF